MDRVKFKVNGVEHSVGCEVRSDVMLVDYLRDTLELRGTKFMCREGGCGGCLVSVSKRAHGPVMAVNSCMTSITSCQDWEITTIEEIGNKKKGYHILQKTLAENYGSQCGYCSPAWIQSMYSLLQNGNRPTMLEIEKSFAGNVCRCTGYRPILTAFKKFGRDAPKCSKIMDIEDSNICKNICLSCDVNKCHEDDDWCVISEKDVTGPTVIEIKLKDNKYWYKVGDSKSIFDILNNKGYDSYMLVFGNTAKGAYPINEYPRVLIDISSVAELKGCYLDQNLIIGVGITLNEFLDVLKASAKDGYFGYLEKFIEHINLVANIPIRNLGSVGGNLMIKHQHNEFESDLFLLFETVGAYLSILTSKGVTKKLSMNQFLKEDMKGKVITNVLLPPLNDECKIVTYKIMPRSQNAHAIVHAGFLYKLSSENKVLESRIAYGGLSPTFIRAKATEKYLIGRSLFENATLQAALNILEGEIIVVENLPNPSAKYRKQLALSLFYKGLTTLCPKYIMNPKYVSAAANIHKTRPLSNGTQKFYTDPSLWPLNQPIPKIEAVIQCAGETKYTTDLPTQPGEVHAAFVLSAVGSGDITKIDDSKALKEPGVLAFYKADDIPGLNSFVSPTEFSFFNANEEVFSSGKIAYFNQPIGLVVAETQQIADRAAKLAATEKGTDVVKTIKGHNTIYGQIHFMMENLSCVTLRTEEGFAVHATSQWMDGVQVMVARALGIDANRIDVCVRRIGGGFGIKLTRNIQSAVACSLVAQKLHRPCRLIVPFTTCTRAVGKRLPCHTDFECEVNASGVIQSIKYRQYEDHGFEQSEILILYSSVLFNNCYTDTKWDFAVYNATTDTAKNSWFRAPGSLEAVSLAECVVERIAYELSLDPFDVRLANVDIEKYNDMIVMAEELKNTASYMKRKAQVAKFNSENRWRKRGLRVSFLRWTPKEYYTLYVTLSVCHSDGTVIITHGGIEMGQGINTKAVQICAYILKIPVTMIQIKGNNTIITPNCFPTGGSLGSQNVGLGVRRCCEALLEKLEPIRINYDNAKWPELIKKAYESDVELRTHSYVGAKDVFDYILFGVSVAEAEIDVLTGEFEILRVDILQDVGQSINPEVDVGQVEGAFIMGQGYWTCENLVYNPCSGELLSDRTWNYYIPLARDIPQDFRIAFRRKSYSAEPILGCIAVGEPPICLSVVIAFAIREAIAAARQEIGIPTTSWFDIDGPFTVERINLACGIRKEDFKFV